MGSAVIFTDVELFLAHHIKARLDSIAAGPPGPHQVLATDVYVGNQYPPERRHKTVVVRDDGGPGTGLVTKSTSTGFTVLAGDDATEGNEATDLALLVSAIVAGCPAVETGNPVAAVLTMNGPFKVPDPSGQPRRYLTAALAVTGEEFTL